MTPEAVEAQRRRCARSADFLPVRAPGDTTTRFAGLLAGEAFQEFHPEVLSTDPLIVYFDSFMSEQEVQRCEQQINKLTFKKSKAGYGGNVKGRHSDTAFCTDNCDASDIVQTVQGRASNISGVPLDNFDFMQALRYREGMFFNAHHDNHPTFHLLPCGTRIYSFFVYLSDEGLEGGATKFPQLNVSVPAKRGGAVLFANTLDSDPMRTDPRAMHEGVPVTKGEKRGLNLWLYQYNYRHFWQMGCTSIELADNLGRAGKAAALEAEEESEPAAGESERPSVVFENPGRKDLSIFWVDPQGKEVLLETAAAGGSKSILSYVGHAFRLRTPRGRLAMEYTATAAPSQQVVVPAKEQEL